MPDSYFRISLRIRREINEYVLSRAMQHSAVPNFKIEYVGEFETEFENILGVESGTRCN
jgi:hypothetical protein